MFICFSVRPYTKSVSRAVLKPPKVYFYDNADVIGDNEGSKFENLVAACLLKRVHFKADFEGFRHELRYIRDKEGREVDFAILKDGALDTLIEVKLSDDKMSRSLQYYAEKLNPNRAVQIVKTLKRPYEKNRLVVTNPIEFFSEFNW